MSVIKYLLSVNTTVHHVSINEKTLFTSTLQTRLGSRLQEFHSRELVPVVLMDYRTIFMFKGPGVRSG